MANWIVENRITGEVASLDRLAAANLRADGINLRLAAAEAEREVRLQEKDHEIRRLTVGRRCLDAGVVRLLNDNAGIKSAGGMPQATVEPVRADAAFATDTDVGMKDKVQRKFWPGWFRRAINIVKDAK